MEDRSPASGEGGAFHGGVMPPPSVSTAAGTVHSFGSSSPGHYLADGGITPMTATSHTASSGNLSPYDPRLTEARRQRDDANAALGRAQAQVTTLEAKVESLTVAGGREASNTLQRVSDLKAEMSDTHLQLIATKDMLHSSELARKAAVRELELLREQNTQLQARCRRLEAEASGHVAGEVHMAQAEIQRLLERNKQLTGDLNDALEENRVARLDVQDIEAAATAAAEDADREIDAAQRIKETLEAANRALREEKALLSEQIHVLQSDERVRSTGYDSALRKAATAEAEVARLKKLVEELTAAREHERSQYNDNFKARMTASSGPSAVEEKLRSEVQALREVNERLTGTARHASEENASLHKQLITLKEHNETVLRRLGREVEKSQAAELELDAAAEEVDRLEAALYATRDTLAAAEAATADAVRAKEEVEERERKLQQRVHQLSDGQVADEEEAQATVVRLASQLEEARESLRAIRGAENQVLRRCQSLSADAQSYQQETQLLEHQLAAAEQREQLATEELQAARKHSSQQDQLVSDLRKDCMRLERDLVASKQELATVTASLDAHRVKDHSQLSSSMAKPHHDEEFERKHAHLVSSNKSLRRQVDEAEITIRRLTSELEMYRQLDVYQSSLETEFKKRRAATSAASVPSTSNWQRSLLKRHKRGNHQTPASAELAEALSP